MRDLTEVRPSTSNRPSYARTAASVSLTRREHAVIAALVQGHANKEIAAALGCSVRTVEYHVANVLHKFGVDTRTRLIAHLLRPEAPSLTPG